MSKQIIEKLIDDIDGGAASETVSFAVDGVKYTIDLSENNAGALRKALAPFVESGTRLGRDTGTWRPGAAPTRRQSSRADNKAVREWAAGNGFEVSERGRIPQNVVEAYEEAHKAPSAPPAKGAVEDSTPAKKVTRTARKKSVPAVHFAAS
jgi:hypothetical protein